MKFKTSIIMKEAALVKEFVEKYNRIPKAHSIGNTTLSPYSIAYLFSKIILDKFKNNECALKDVIAYNAEQYKDTIKGEEVKLDDYTVMINNFLVFCTEKKRVPAYITTQKSKTKVSFELYLYCLAKIINFYNKNKYLPNYCTFNLSVLSNTQNTNTNTKKEEATTISVKTKTVNNCTNPFTSKPHYLEQGCNKLGQCTSYYCGPHSIHQAIRKFGITKYSEKQIAAMVGTTTKGSDHQGINTAIAKISKQTGVKLSVKWMNFSSLGKDATARFKALAKLLCKSNTAVICHIGYQGSGSSATGSIFGHYECLDKVNTKTKYVRALNSLGTKKSDGSYMGHVQDRPYSLQARFFANTPGGQAALCIITKG